MTSTHYTYYRQNRTKSIRLIGGQGRLYTAFLVDRGHPDGPEIHSITDNAIIIIHNANTNKLVTQLIARPGQIRRYFSEEQIDSDEKLQAIINKAWEHQKMHINKWI